MILISENFKFPQGIPRENIFTLVFLLRTEIICELPFSFSVATFFRTKGNKAYLFKAKDEKICFHGMISKNLL